MPLAECGFHDQLGLSGTQALVNTGPTLVVDIGFDVSFHASPSGGTPTVAAKNIPALIDTGATESCIDDQLAQSLSLPLVDRRKISGIGGHHEVSVYLAQIVTPLFGYVQYGQFSGVALRQGGQKHEVLLGRTFLRTFFMIYDGVRGQVTLAR